MQHFERCIVVVKRTIFYFISIARFMSDEDRVSMVPSPKPRPRPRLESSETKTKTKIPKFKTKTETKLVKTGLETSRVQD